MFTNPNANPNGNVNVEWKVEGGAMRSRVTVLHVILTLTLILMSISKYMYVNYVNVPSYPSIGDTKIES